VYANSSKDEPGFNNKLVFETTMVPVLTSVEWIEKTLTDIKQTLDSEKLPTIGEKCEFCPYREASG